MDIGLYLQSNSLYGGGSADHLVHGGVGVEALGTVVLWGLDLTWRESDTHH